MKEIKLKLKEMNYACNAQARTIIANEMKKTVGLPSANELNIKKWAPVIKYAIEVGGAKHGTTYSYLNAQKIMTTANVYDLYDIPEGLVNPFLVCFSGYMLAAIYTLEAFRAYSINHGKYLPIVATGEGGNKGLFANVFNRKDGLVIKSEAEAYMRIMEKVLDPELVRKYERKVSDTDTKGNFVELYQLAKKLGLNEATFILCSGQPWYTKRLLAEGMLEFGKEDYADIKINLVVLDCPLILDCDIPEGHLSELMLGYIAASLGPLTKDTCPLNAPDFAKERYLLPEVAEADWSVFEELITYYSNMGWPNYQELLYKVEHETAVYNIIMADLRARSSFSPEEYDRTVKKYLNFYISWLKMGAERFFD